MTYGKIALHGKIITTDWNCSCCVTYNTVNDMFRSQNKKKIGKKCVSQKPRNPEWNIALYYTIWDTLCILCVTLQDGVLQNYIHTSTKVAWTTVLGTFFRASLCTRHSPTLQTAHYLAVLVQTNSVWIVYNSILTWEASRLLVYRRTVFLLCCTIWYAVLYSWNCRTVQQDLPGTNESIILFEQ